jgi:hypothetical protein
MMERLKRDGNHCLPQNNLIQDSQGNEKKQILSSRFQQNKDK